MEQGSRMAHSCLGLPDRVAIGAWVFLTPGTRQGRGHLGVFGVGYEDLNAALSGPFDWRIAVLFLVGKLIATICCYGMGGIFSLTFFF